MSLFDTHIMQFIKKVRSCGPEKRRFIEESISSIRREITSPNPCLNEAAALKLIFLHQLGYDVGWSAFGMISLIGQPKLTYKRLGYLSATLCFHSHRELLTLLINTIRKDMSCSNIYIASVSMEALVHFIDANLALNISPEIANYINSSKPYLKKRALILICYCIKKSPELCETYMSRILKLLSDSDRGVQATACNVMCELVYDRIIEPEGVTRELMEVFFSSPSNWVLIKIMKMLSLASRIDRAVLKSIDQRIIPLLQGATAPSLLFECIRFCIKIFKKSSKLLNICFERLKGHLACDDANVQYMALLSLKDLLEYQRESVMSLKSQIVNFMCSKDAPIRYISMSLISSMVDKSNLRSIVALFVDQIKPDHEHGAHLQDEFADSIIQNVIIVCSKDDYALVTNFEWYIDVLLRLVVISIELTKNKSGEAIATELLSIALRVQAIRVYLVPQIERILNNVKESFILALPAYSIMLQILVWITAEFHTHIYNPEQLLADLRRPWVLYLRYEAQAVILHSVLKIFSFMLCNHSLEPPTSDRVGEEEEGGRRAKTIESLTMSIEFYRLFVTSSNLQTQERACCYLSLLESALEAFISQGPSVFHELRVLFTPELKQVSPEAQSSVPVPPSLDLDAWINLESPTQPCGSQEDKLDSHAARKQRKQGAKKKHHGEAKPGCSKGRGLSATRIYEEKEYPEQIYEIAPIDTGEKLVSLTSPASPNAVYLHDSPKQQQLAPTKPRIKNRKSVLKNEKITVKKKPAPPVALNPPVEVVEPVNSSSNSHPVVNQQQQLNHEPSNLEHGHNASSSCLINDLLSGHEYEKLVFSAVEEKITPSWMLSKAIDALSMSFTIEIKAQDSGGALFLIRENDSQFAFYISVTPTAPFTVVLSCKSDSEEQLADMFARIRDVVFAQG